MQKEKIDINQDEQLIAEEQFRVQEKLLKLKETEGYKEYLDVLKGLYKSLVKQAIHFREFDEPTRNKSLFLKAQIELIEAIVPIVWDQVNDEIADEQLDESLTN